MWQLVIHENFGNDVASLLSHKEQEWWLHGAVLVPRSIVVEDEMGEGFAVSSVLTGYLKRRVMRYGVESSSCGRSHAVYWHFLEMWRWVSASCLRSQRKGG